MKTTKILQAISLLLILVIAVSCRNSRSTTGTQYPRNPTPPTETPTKTYPVVYADGSNLPPGQAKKIYGSQSAKAYAPGQRKKYANRYPLVIIHTPDIVISRYNDGRYYYRNTAGHTYWKGYDGRYYIDEKHLKGMEYEESDYDDWKFKGQKNNKAQESKGKEQEAKLKDDQKSKDVEHVSNVKKQEKGQNQAKDNDQKGKEPEEKVKDDQKTKDVDHVSNVKKQEKGQNQAKDNDQKGKDQADQKTKDSDKKGKDQADQKAKGNDKKEKDQTDQKTKDDNSQKGNAKSKVKA